jgi:transcriptional regulator with XRE-family HTH domain
MARRSKPGSQHTGLYYAREARGMSRSELVRLSGVSKQQLSRLENGLIRLRLDHLAPFAPHLGYTPEQMLLWGRFPGTEMPESSEKPAAEPLLPGVAELDTRASTGTAVGKRSMRKDGRHLDPVLPEQWLFPSIFIHEALHSTMERLLVVPCEGDSMTPTIASGERVIVDTEHKTPSPDGLYAIRDALDSVVIRRLHVLHSQKHASVSVISDNPKNPSEEIPLNDLDVVGKVLCCLKLF